MQISPTGTLVPDIILTKISQNDVIPDGLICTN